MDTIEKQQPPDAADEGGLPVDCIMNEQHILSALQSPSASYDEAVLSPLIASYEGLSATCVLVASWLGTLRRVSAVYSRNSLNDDIECGEIEQESLSEQFSPAGGSHDYDHYVLEALCLLLERRFDPDKLRHFMETSSDSNDGWRPPPFYWQLMRTPMTARTLKQLCGKDRRSEFLLAFNEDLLAIESRTKRNWKVSMDKELGHVTSSFTIFSRALAEVIHDFLLEDENEDLGSADPNHFSRLLCHTENSYLYSQAILHFLPLWRPDLIGCRRLSQAIYRYVRDIRCDRNVADVGLRFTGLGSFPELYRAFVALQRQDPKAVLPQDDVCSLADAVANVLACFYRYQSFLYSRPRRRRPHERVTAVAIPDDLDTSQATIGEGIHDDGPVFYPIHGGFGKRRASLSVPQPDANTSNLLAVSHTMMYPSEALEQDLDSIAGLSSASSNTSDQRDDAATSNQSFANGSGVSSEVSGFIGLGSLAPSQLGSDSIPLQDQLASAYCVPSSAQHHRGGNDSSSAWGDGGALGGSSVGTVIQTVNLPFRCLPVPSDVDDQTSIRLPPASQAGDLWENEYDRLRYGPQSCPLHAIREGVLIDALLRDFITPSVVLSPAALPKTIELLLALTVLCPYELLVQQDEISQVLRAQLSTTGKRPLSHLPQLPGHWTTEGAYEREDGNDDFLDDGVEEGEEIDRPGWQHTPLDNAFHSSSLDPSHSDVTTPMIRIGLCEGAGAGKIGGRGYAYEQQLLRKTAPAAAYTSFFTHHDDEDETNDIDHEGSVSAKASCSQTTSDSGSSQTSNSSAGSWTDTAWQKGASPLLSSPYPNDADDESPRCYQHSDHNDDETESDATTSNDEWKTSSSTSPTFKKTRKTEPEGEHPTQQKRYSYYFTDDTDDKPDVLDPVSTQVRKKDTAFAAAHELKHDPGDSAFSLVGSSPLLFPSDASPSWNSTEFHSSLLQQRHQGPLAGPDIVAAEQRSPQFTGSPTVATHTDDAHLYSFEPTGSPTTWIQEPAPLSGSPPFVSDRLSDPCLVPIPFVQSNGQLCPSVTRSDSSRNQIVYTQSTSFHPPSPSLRSDTSKRDVSQMSNVSSGFSLSEADSKLSSHISASSRRLRPDPPKRRRALVDSQDEPLPPEITDATSQSGSSGSTIRTASSVTTSVFSFNQPYGTTRSLSDDYATKERLTDDKRWESGTDTSTIADKLFTMKSVVGSDIFADPQRQRTIGLPVSATARRQATYTRKEFRSLQRQVETYKERGRRDLFEAYSIVRDPLVPSIEARVAQLLRCTRSLIGASVTLSFLEHRVIFLDDEDVDPLLTLSPAILSTFVAICQRHPKKRLDVLSLLHRCFQKSHEFFQRPTTRSMACFDAADHSAVALEKQQHGNLVLPGNAGDSKLQQCKRRVFALLMWLLGSGLYAGVFAFLRFHMSHVDHSLLRKQLELILGYCKPPYSPSFVAALLHLLHELVFVQKSLNLMESINTGLRHLILSSLDHTLQSWAPRQPPPEVMTRTTEIRDALAGTGNGNSNALCRNMYSVAPLSSTCH